MRDCLNAHKRSPRSGSSEIGKHATYGRPTPCSHGVLSSAFFTASTSSPISRFSFLGIPDERDRRFRTNVTDFRAFRNRRSRCRNRRSRSPEYARFGPMCAFTGYLSVQSAMWLKTPFQPQPFALVVRAWLLVRFRRSASPKQES